MVAEIIGKDEADSKSAILEVRAAAGGQESQLFALELFNMYSAYAELKDWKWETLAIADGELGGCRVCLRCIFQAALCCSLLSRLTDLCRSFSVTAGIQRLYHWQRSLRPSQA